MVDVKSRLCRQQILFDLRHGIGMKKGHFLVPVVMALLTCIGDYRIFLRQQVTPPTVLDYLLQCFAGMPPFQMDLKELFYIPAGWVVFYFWLIYMNGKYPKTYLKGFGIQVLVRSGKIQNWWIAKCIWTVVHVLTYYTAVYLVIGINVCTVGSGGWYLTGTGYMRGRSADLTTEEFLACATILPILTTIALCLLQTVVSLLTNTIVGIVGAIALLIVSAYSCKWYWLGNYLMILRNDGLQAEGVSCGYGIVFAFVLSGICIFLGNLVLKRKDFIYRKGEF